MDSQMSAEVDWVCKWACPYLEMYDVVICTLFLRHCDYITETWIKTTENKYNMSDFYNFYIYCTADEPYLYKFYLLCMKEYTPSSNIWGLIKHVVLAAT